MVFTDQKLIYRIVDFDNGRDGDEALNFNEIEGFEFIEYDRSVVK